MQLYDRDESIEGARFTYDYLISRLRAVVEHDRERRKRQGQLDGIKRSCGTNANSAQIKAKPKPKTEAKAQAPPAADAADATKQLEVEVLSAFAKTMLDN